MATHTIEGFIVYEQWFDEKGSFTFTTYKPSVDDEPGSRRQVLVRAHSFEVDVPDDFDPRPGMVAALEAQKVALRKELGEKLMRIDQQISKLLCIENAAATS